MRQAVKDGDLPRALGAAFDARLDAEIDLRSVLSSIDPVDGAEETPLGIDGLLERAGLHELLAARVEIASDFLGGQRAGARPRRPWTAVHGGRSVEPIAPWTLGSTRSWRIRAAERRSRRCAGTA